MCATWIMQKEKHSSDTRAIMLSEINSKSFNYITSLAMWTLNGCLLGSLHCAKHCFFSALIACQ